MKEVDNVDSIKEEWVCESGSQNPPVSDNQQRNCDYFVDSLFEEAEKVGAKCFKQVKAEKNPGVAGMVVKPSLCERANGDCSFCKPPASEQPQGKEGMVDLSIKLWKNGFTVNDDFRSYSDGASQQFLNSIKKGELPLELQGVFDKEEVDVKVEDKKHEVCTSTKPMFQPFSGRGHRLGSATPKIVCKAKSSAVESEDGVCAVPLKPLEPVTSLRIWLANGTRIVQKFNTSQRVSHVKDFIEKSQGSQRSRPFSLATALPVLRLLDETLTLEEAGVHNAVVIQRLQRTAEPFRGLSSPGFTDKVGV
ncbi:UBX domain-containing protein 2A [Echinops telfairi]|uniref:UBX domain-containing protein 2A n=1 Tax=Echinops telfairi TaxID=9371 RepID=A0AC55CSQ3_ECHTE|nr:UBX domain-containing protein 2A [Echinops telfairi]